MKIHKTEFNKEIDFGSPERASAFFRSIYQEIHIEKEEEKGGSNKEGKKTKTKKEKTIEHFEYIYYSLSASKKFVIHNLIKDLLSQSKSNGCVGAYLEGFLNEYKLTYKELASYIYGYRKISFIVHESNCEDKNTENKWEFENIRGKIQKLLKTVNTKEDSELLKLIADFFSVSPDVLITGKGIRYSIDLEKLKEVVDNKKIDVDTFLKEHQDMDIYDENFSEEDKDYHRQYIHHSAKVFAEIASEQLNIDLDDILIKEDCWIELEPFPFYRYYQLLTDKNKKIVKHVIENLSVEEIK